MDSRGSKAKPRPRPYIRGIPEGPKHPAALMHLTAYLYGRNAVSEQRTHQIGRFWGTSGEVWDSTLSLRQYIFYFVEPLRIMADCQNFFKISVVRADAGVI